MTADRMGLGCILAAFIGVVVLGIAFYGTIAWAIVQLVNYITGG